MIYESCVHTQNAQYVLTQSTSDFIKMKEKFVAHYSSLSVSKCSTPKERKKRSWCMCACVWLCANIYLKTDLFLHTANMIE